MSLDQIKEIVKISGTFDLDFSDEMDEYLEKVYEPVRAAVADNEKTVMDYLVGCSADEIKDVYTAIEDGALDGNNQEAAALCVKHCKEMGFKVDEEIASLAGHFNRQ